MYILHSAYTVYIYIHICMYACVTIHILSYFRSLLFKNALALLVGKRLLLRTPRPPNSELGDPRGKAALPCAFSWSKTATWVMRVMEIRGMPGARCHLVVSSGEKPIELPLATHGNT